jgi:hypothetical protein
MQTCTTKLAREIATYTNSPAKHLHDEFILLRAAHLLLMQACADKLAREISTYGNPPKFPTDDVEEEPIDEVSHVFVMAES